MESFKLFYWHWLVFGMILMLLELVVPSFTIFWFGLGGLLVGLLMLVFAELPVVWQIFLWVMASVGFAVFWFKVMKPRMKDETMAGISREAVLGETAMVVRKPDGERRGEMRFSVPVLGSDSWSFICTENVEVGDRVVVRDVSGNTMMVQPTLNSEVPKNRQEG
jgi:membrane protein implicated in regulation of membrane protease activity